jgi:hypothetical protein
MKIERTFSTFEKSFEWLSCMEIDTKMLNEAKVLLLLLLYNFVTTYFIIIIIIYYKLLLLLSFLIWFMMI